jgi:nitrite reductase/ring-hydroxylating ferredoxin subunit
MREPLIRVSDIPQDDTVTADLLGREVLLMLLNGQPRAYLNVCMHHGGPLRLEDDTFTCDWHGSTFDVRTGRALSGPHPSAVGHGECQKLALGLLQARDLCFDLRHATFQEALGVAAQA